MRCRPAYLSCAVLLFQVQMRLSLGGAPTAVIFPLAVLGATSMLGAFRTMVAGLVESLGMRSAWHRLHHDVQALWGQTIWADSVWETHVEDPLARRSGSGPRDPDEPLGGSCKRLVRAQAFR